MPSILMTLHLELTDFDRSKLAILCELPIDKLKRVLFRKSHMVLSPDRLEVHYSRGVRIVINPNLIASLEWTNKAFHAVQFQLNSREEVKIRNFLLSVVARVEENHR